MYMYIQNSIFQLPHRLAHLPNCSWSSTDSCRLVWIWLRLFVLLVLLVDLHRSWSLLVLHVMWYGCHVVWMSCGMDVMWYGENKNQSYTTDIYIYNKISSCIPNHMSAIDWLMGCEESSYSGSTSSIMT